jgi:hypothetical protein
MQPEALPPRRSPIKSPLVLLIAVGLAFGVGFGWQYLEASKLRRQLQAAQEQSQVQGLETTLTDVAIATLFGSYEEARTGASAFFTDLQTHVSNLGSEAPPQFESILGRRDQLITALSRSEPGAKALVDQMINDFSEATGRPTRSFPMGQEQEHGPSLVPEGGPDTVQLPQPGEEAQRPNTVADTVRG